MASHSFAAVDPVPTIPSDHAERMSRGQEEFDREVRDILAQSCLKCHGGEKTKGDFDLSTREALLKGGADGVSVTPFHPEASRFIKMLRHEEEPYMPEKKPKLPEDVIEKIAKWIEHGAPYTRPMVEGKKPERDRSKVTEEDRKWWSFQPLSEQGPPVGPEANMVDRFINAKAAAKGFKLAPRADKRTLIRRATLDLTGLPPTPEEVERFLADNSPEAWSKLIDELLSRPAYGERWARHWMDVARYGESSGFEQDYDRVGSYQYRDFLIGAFNDDMPFQKFVQWQIAGDEYAPGNPKALAATAFLSLGVFPTQITINELERVRYEDMDDMLSTTGAAFLGLTVGCARCHDHKYDPIPSRDYYRMLSTFTGTVRSEVELDVDPEKTREQKAKWREKVDRIVEEQKQIETMLKPSFERFLEQDLANKKEPEAWSVLVPTSIKGNAGTTFATLKDGSSLAKKGDVPDHENYEITAPVSGAPISGLRLEALVDGSLPKGGVGRASNGDFQLSRIKIALEAPDQSRREVALSNAVADFEKETGDDGVLATIKGKAGKGWSVAGKEKGSHQAVFQFTETVVPEEGAKLVVTLEFSGQGKHSIGRPRLAITGANIPSLKLPTWDAVVIQSLRTGTVPASAEDRLKLQAWWFANDAKWKAVEARRQAMVSAEPTGLSKVLVASESFPPIRYHTAGGSVETYKETYFLKRGNVALKDGVASPGFLQVLSRAPEEQWSWNPPEKATYAGKRHRLADWILDEKSGAGAISARVFVNRIWLHHFGQGIVSTPNDFGKTGGTPSQPELLDWLAKQLLTSGGSIKQLHRLMMNSEVYQQAAVKDSAKEKADPANELFVRRLPKRLEGEAIRDSMLSVSGLLDPTMYGPGIRDEKSGRRSIYFQVKRSQQINSMVSFDQPEPLASQGLRAVTTVAPQALILMNSQQAQMCAQAFAKRIQKKTGALAPWEEQIREAYLMALSREPKSEEIDASIHYLKAQIERLQASRNAEEAAVQAFADFAQVILELNEFVYRP